MTMLSACSLDQIHLGTCRVQSACALLLSQGKKLGHARMTTRSAFALGHIQPGTLGPKTIRTFVCEVGFGRNQHYYFCIVGCLLMNLLIELF